MINEPRTEWRQLRKWEPKCTLHAIKRKQLRIMLAMWHNNVHRNVDFLEKHTYAFFGLNFVFFFLLFLYWRWYVFLIIGRFDWYWCRKKNNKKLRQTNTINIYYTPWVTKFALEKKDAKEPKVERISKKGRCQQQSVFGFKKMTSNYIHIRNRCETRISN